MSWDAHLVANNEKTSPTQVDYLRNLTVMLQNKKLSVLAFVADGDNGYGGSV